MKLKVLDLFSGIGGFSLGIERTGGFETVAFCERDKYCRRVLEKNWPGIPIYDDIRNVEYEGPVDVICGGFPCQPFSYAGQRKGAVDDRYLWPEMLRTVQTCRPAWVLCENVVGITSMGFERSKLKVEDRTIIRTAESDDYNSILTYEENLLIQKIKKDLEEEDYAVQIFVIPACAIGAKHERSRVWIVGYCDAYRRWNEPITFNQTRTLADSEHVERQDTKQDGCGPISGREAKAGRREGSGEASGRGGVLANPKSERLRETGKDSKRQKKRTAGRRAVCNASGTRSKTRVSRSNAGKEGKPEIADNPSCREQRGSGKRDAVESRLGRSIDGVSGWLDGYWEDGIPRVTERDQEGFDGRPYRLSALGNAVLPQLVQVIGETIIYSCNNEIT